MPETAVDLTDVEKVVAGFLKQRTFVLFLLIVFDFAII